MEPHFSAYSMPITILNKDAAAGEGRRVTADEAGEAGGGERASSGGDPWEFLSHSKNSLDLAEIANTVEPQAPKSGDVQRTSAHISLNSGGIHKSCHKNFRNITTAAALLPN